MKQLLFILVSIVHFFIATAQQTTLYKCSKQYIPGNVTESDNYKIKSLIEFVAAFKISDKAYSPVKQISLNNNINNKEEGKEKRKTIKITDVAASPYTLHVTSCWGPTPKAAEYYSILSKDSFWELQQPYKQYILFHHFE